MKAAWKMLLAVGVVAAVVLVVRAEKEKDVEKEVTLKGEITCSKCGLKETKTCGNAIKVKDGDKEVIYFFKDKGKGEKYHKEICTTTKKGSVTGVVSKGTGDDKDKMFITPAKKNPVKFVDE